MVKLTLVSLSLLFLMNYMSSSAHSQEIWISNKLNDAWSTPLEHIIFEKKQVKMDCFFQIIF